KQLWVFLDGADHLTFVIMHTQRLTKVSGNDNNHTFFLVKGNNILYFCLFLVQIDRKLNNISCIYFLPVWIFRCPFPISLAGAFHHNKLTRTLPLRRSVY